VIIDAHVHIIDKISGVVKDGEVKGAEYGIINIGNSSIYLTPPLNSETTFTARTLEEFMIFGNVDKAMVLQGCLYGSKNDYINEINDQYKHNLAFAMYLNPWEEHALKQFDKLLDQNIYKALKLECSINTGFFGLHESYSLTDKCIYSILNKMQKNNMTLVLDLGEPLTRSYQTKAVEQIARVFKDLKIVICHLGQPRSWLKDDEEKMELWKKQISLAKLGNIWFDTASLTSYFSELYAFEKGYEFFEIAVNLISADRIMMGTDIPGTLVNANYQQMLNLPKYYAQKMGLSISETQKIMGLNAEFVYFS
jgi:predicted TIM-barrel fold metal-dependent hydrolase